jgi:hypothetical protein
MSSRMNRKSFLRKVFVGPSNTSNDEGLTSGSVHDLRGGRAGEGRYDPAGLGVTVVSIVDERRSYR